MTEINPIHFGEMRSDIKAQGEVLREIQAGIKDISRQLVEFQKALYETENSKVDKTHCAGCADKYLTKRDFFTVTGTVGTIGAVIAWVSRTFAD